VICHRLTSPQPCKHGLPEGRSKSLDNHGAPMEDRRSVKRKT
jgi:hypothetical protein